MPTCHLLEAENGVTNVDGPVRKITIS